MPDIFYNQLENYLTKVVKKEFNDCIDQKPLNDQIRTVSELIQDSQQDLERCQMEFRLPDGDRSYYISRKRGIILSKRKIVMYINFLADKIRQ